LREIFDILHHFPNPLAQSAGKSVGYADDKAVNSVFAELGAEGAKIMAALKVKQLRATLDEFVSLYDHAEAFERIGPAKAFSGIRQGL
jgi:hypothetical protein